MMTKKYTANTIQDAMNLAKMELGDNITLIDKKEVSLEYKVSFQRKILN